MLITNSLVGSYSSTGISTLNKLSLPDDMLAFHAGNLAVVQLDASVSLQAFWGAVRRNKIPLIPGANAAIRGLVTWCPPGEAASVQAALYDMTRLLQTQEREDDYVVQSESVRRQLSRREVMRKLNSFGVVANAPFVEA
jgi:hypothetical protein